MRVYPDVKFGFLSTPLNKEGNSQRWVGQGGARYAVLGAGVNPGP